jgi:hypothetical protein
MFAAKNAKLKTYTNLLADLMEHAHFAKVILAPNTLKPTRRFTDTCESLMDDTGNTCQLVHVATAGQRN